MISIVVIAFSTIAVTVFSDEGVVKPEHIPHTDLQEHFSKSDNNLQIVHSGGEAIDKSAIKIIVNVDGVRHEFDGAHDDFTIKRPPDGKAVNVFTLGDYIEINNLNAETGKDIDMYFIDTPSQQVVQKAVLQRGSGEVPDWITPHPYGSVYSSSVESGEWQYTELVAINDGRLTNSSIPQNSWVTENYTFGIDEGEMDISEFASVMLKIIYQVHGNSPGTLTLKIFNGTEWTPIAPEKQTMSEYNNVNEYLTDIIPYVNTTSKLEKLQVSFSVKGSETSNGILGVDFVGIQVN